MRKKTVVIIVAIFLAIMFFPISSTHVISGKGEVLSNEKVKIGDCRLEIDITEISSLATCYKKNFTFTLDGKSFDEFESNAYSEAGEICLISQMYYNKIMDEMCLCSLVYKTDFSYAIIALDDQYYYINVGADIPYAKLPIS